MTTSGFGSCASSVDQFFLGKHDDLLDVVLMLHSRLLGGSVMQSRHSLSVVARAVHGLRTASSEAGKTSTVDPAEVAKFASEAAKWWHPDGSAAPLHRMNPTRIAYIRSVIERSGVNQRMAEALPHTSKPLAGIDLVDVGCGGKL